MLQNFFILLLLLPLYACLSLPRSNTRLFSSSSTHETSPSFEAPKLDTPVWSLSTLNDDGESNLNIVTYVSPMGRRPKYYYALSLYRTTLSYQNFCKHGWGILSLLDDTTDAEVIVPLLGKQSGRDVAKVQTLRDKGISVEKMDWSKLPNLHGHIQTSSSYQTCPPPLHTVASTRSVLGIKRIPNQPPLFCGDHDLFLCEITDHYSKDQSSSSSSSSSSPSPSQALSTRTLRQLNLI